MTVKSLLINPVELFNVVEKPYYDPALSYFGFDNLDAIVSDTFRNIPEESKVRYSTGPLPLKSQEQKDMTKLYHAMALLGHREHTRYSGNPFGVHPVTAARFESKFNVSFCALLPVLVHDLEEEWGRALGLSKEDPEYYSKCTALFFGSGIMAYKYVTEKYKDEKPERFFQHLNSVQLVLNRLTRRPHENYFDNLRKSFYKLPTNRDLEELLKRNHKSFPLYVKEYFGIDDEKLVKCFIRDVVRYKPPKELRGHYIRKEVKEKNRRRAIMGEIADAYANRDLRMLPKSRVIKILSKDLIIINQTHLYFKDKKSEETKRTLNRIDDELYELKDALFGGDGVIHLIIDDLLKYPTITKSFIQEFNLELGKYLMGPFADMRTSGEQDDSQFRNMLNACLNVLHHFEPVVVPENDVHGQYRYLRVFQSIGEKFLASKDYYIHRMSLKQLHKERTAGMKNKGAAKK